MISFVFCRWKSKKSYIYQQKSSVFSYDTRGTVEEWEKKGKKVVDKGVGRGYNSKAPLRNGEFRRGKSTLKIKQRLKKETLEILLILAVEETVYSNFSETKRDKPSAWNEREKLWIRLWVL